MALLTKFKIIWCKRTGSPTKVLGIFLSMLTIKSKFFSFIFVSNKCNIDGIVFVKLKGICSKTIFPASTFAKSKMSLIKTINASPLILIAEKYSFCFSVNSVFKSTFVKPIIAFIGVRISWLILERNCCLERTATSAI